MEYISVHNHDFKIDTNDWQDFKDGERCRDLIKEALSKLTPDQAKEYYNASIKLQEIEAGAEVEQIDGVYMYDHPSIKALQDIAEQCASVILDTYKDSFLQVMTGHNYFINALYRIPDPTLTNDETNGWGNSTVATAYVYERIHDILDITEPEEVSEALSRFHDELAHNFYVDTGVKIGQHLGWNKTQPNPSPS